MKKIVLFLLMLPAMLLAAPVDPNLAQQVAENFINAPETGANSAIRKAPRKPKRMMRAPKQITNDQQFYVFNSEDGEGFVIVAADNIAHPVLGYSKTGIFDVNNAPDNVRWWLAEYNREISWAKANNISQSEEIAEEWGKTLSSQIKAATVVVGPLIQTKWDQQGPYNNMCPIYNGSDRAMTGCVATAVAQIMNYWQHPVRGTGSHSYTSKSRQFQLSANFSSSIYDWNNMAETYSYYNANLDYFQYSRTTAQKNAVATLMSDVGIAFEMDYAIDNIGQSSSSNIKAWYVLPNYFGYDRSLFPVRRDDHTLLSWMGVLGNQLDQQRPILYQGNGYNSNMGHSFICDGYDSDLRFHFNFGWSGLADSWFYTEALTPNTGGSGAGDKDYSYNQVAVINIMPAQATPPTYNLQLVSELTMYDGSQGTIIDTETTNVNSFDSLSVTANIANMFSSSTFNGTVYAALYVTNTQEYIMIDSVENVRIPVTNSVEELENNYRSFTFKHAGGVFLEDGVYAILIYYKEKNGTIKRIVGSDYFANSLFFVTQYQFRVREGKYIVVANRGKNTDKNWYYMTADLGSASTKRFQAVNTGIDSLGAVPIYGLEDKYIWSLEKDGSKWKLKSGDQYVTWSSGNSANLGATAKTLTFDVADNQVLAHFNDGSAERYLSLNATTNNNYFAFYSGTAQVEQLVFLPYIEPSTPEIPVHDCKAVPYSETFASSIGDFSVLNLTLPSGFTSIWNWDSQYGMVAKCIKGSTKYESESWLISPCVELPENETCVLSFSHAAKFFQSTSQMSLWISADYDESDPEAAQWNRLIIPTYPTGSNWNWYESGDIDLSEYKGQYINIAFRYTSTSSYAPQWEIKNFAIRKQSTTGIDGIYSNKPSAIKILCNGQIYIIRGDKTYTLQGQEVK